MPINFLLVIFFFPCFIIIWEKKLKNERFFCNFCYAPCDNCKRKRESKKLLRLAAEGKLAEDEDNNTVWEKFFGGPFAFWVHKLRIPIIVVLSLWGVVAFSMGTKIEKLAETETFFPADHWIIKLFTISLGNFNDGSLNK